MSSKNSIDTTTIRVCLNKEVAGIVEEMLQKFKDIKHLPVTPSWLHDFILPTKISSTNGRNTTNLNLTSKYMIITNEPFDYNENGY